MAKEKKDKKEVANKRRTPAVPPKKKRGSLKDYFKGVKVEMKKVVWPTRKELGSYTAVSYTHLDVYKRQRCKGPGRSGRKEKGDGQRHACRDIGGR